MHVKHQSNFKMFVNIFMSLFIIWRCDGQIYQRENPVFVPPYSIMSMLQHGNRLQAFQKHMPVVSDSDYTSATSDSHYIQAKKTIDTKHSLRNHEVNDLKYHVPQAIHSILKRPSGIAHENQASHLRDPGRYPVRSNSSKIQEEPVTSVHSKHLFPPTSNTTGFDTASTVPVNEFRTGYREKFKQKLTPLYPEPRGVLPEDVCNRCPVDAEDTSTLLPCSCAGNTGAQAGMISIKCPDIIQTTEDLRAILTENQTYWTTHVFRFTLMGSPMGGIVSKSLWGDLDFVQVLLDDNNFNIVDYQAFANSNNTLHYLSLKNNQVSQYFTTPESDFPFLETLVLSHNKMSFIFTEAFKYKGLKFLDLSYNEILSIGDRSFAALDSLTELNLSYNKLTKLDDGAFLFDNHSHIDLLLIDLSCNNISDIAGTAFAKLLYVQIDLTNNLLKTVSEEAFKPVLTASNYYAVISLIGNPIVCDCDVLWIVNSTKVQSCFDNFYCANLQKPIREVTPDDLNNCTDRDPLEQLSTSTSLPAQDSTVLTTYTKEKEKTIGPPHKLP